MIGNLVALHMSLKNAPRFLGKVVPYQIPSKYQDYLASKPIGIDIQFI